MLALEGRIDWHRKISGIPDPEPATKPATDVAARLRQAFTQLATRN